MDLNRRDFVAAAGMAVCGCLAGCSADNFPSGATSEGEQAAGGGSLPPETNPNGTVEIGNVSDYPHDGVYDKYATTERVYVVRRSSNLYALRSMCTHRACLVKAGGDEFKCPCHGSRFELDGTVTKGPATRSLPHYAITKGDGGKLTVDKSKRFGAEQSDPAKSVTIA